MKLELCQNIQKQLPPQEGSSLTKKYEQKHVFLQLFNSSEKVKLQLFWKSKTDILPSYHALN